MEIKCVFSPAVLSQQQRETGAGVSEWKGTLFAKSHVSKVEDVRVEEKKNPWTIKAVWQGD